MLERIDEDRPAFSEPRHIRASQDVDSLGVALDVPAARTAGAMLREQTLAQPLGGENGVGAGSDVGSCRIAF